MSSDLKDARWGLALSYAEREGKGFTDYTYYEFQRLLDQAQEVLNDHPEDIARWASVFRAVEP